MAIKKNLDIKIKNGEAKLSEKFYIYQNDRGIELRLKVNLSGIGGDSTRTLTRPLVFENEGVYAGATIRKPNGDIIGRDMVEVIDSIIRFQIDKDMTDEVDEIGVYTIQFHLYDVENNRITIPPVEFEVKELIGNIGENAFSIGKVDEGRANYCTTISGEEIEIYSNGRYIKTVWQSGDLISTQKLNKIETALEDTFNKLDRVFTDDEADVNKIPYKTESDINIKSVKDALDKILYVNLTVNLSSNVSNLLELGLVVSDMTFNWTYNKNVVSQIFNGESLANDIRQYRYGENFSTDKNFSLIANDGTKSVTSNLRFEFVNPVYIGHLDRDISYVNSNEIKKLEKRVVKPSSQSFTYNVDAKRMCIAVPSTWVIKSIIDPNNFDILPSFEIMSMDIDGVDGIKRSYKVYYSQITSQNNFTVKFNV